MLIASNGVRQFCADVCENQITPAIQGHQTITSGQVHAQLPFVWVEAFVLLVLGGHEFSLRGFVTAVFCQGRLGRPFHVE